MTLRKYGTFANQALYFLRPLYCIVCFRKINHLVVKNHLHSSSCVQEVVSSTHISMSVTCFMISLYSYIDHIWWFKFGYFLKIVISNFYSLNGPVRHQKKQTAFLFLTESSSDKFLRLIFRE
jgi:hypothetical protein